MTFKFALATPCETLHWQKLAKPQVTKLEIEKHCETLRKAAELYLQKHSETLQNLAKNTVYLRNLANSMQNLAKLYETIFAI